MGFYSRVIFPRLCDWVMSDLRMAALRHETLAQVAGEILEIGFGTGLNLPHYPEPVRTITTTRRSRPWPRVPERDWPTSPRASGRSGCQFSSARSRPVGVALGPVGRATQLENPPLVFGIK